MRVGSRGVGIRSKEIESTLKGAAGRSDTSREQGVRQVVEMDVESRSWRLTSKVGITKSGATLAITHQWPVAVVGSACGFCLSLPPRQRAR